MSRLASIACSLALLAALPMSSPAQDSAAIAGVASVTATVEAIDLDKRQVTLKGEDGKRVKLTVGEEARNLPQLQVGDLVTFDYYELLAVGLEPASGGVRERIETTEVERAPRGAKPGGHYQETVDITGTIQAIDAKHRTVTLKGPERTLTLSLDKGVDLSGLKVGQTVLARYVEGFAISTRTPEKR
jgi:Cu/Ag efflux protein CusF